VRVLSVIGARPQFIKAALLSAELERRGVQEILVHTGQHYDYRMSEIFFEQLHIPQPAHFLEVGSANHGAQTGEMMKRLEPIIIKTDPDWVIVYGDTNSTLAGAMVAAKLNVPVAHVEAGLRSFNRTMPEEINRIVADHVSTLLLVPNESSARQLLTEGISSGVAVVGDLMIDLVKSVAASLPPSPAVLAKFELQGKQYGVVTIHRASNTDDTEAFARIVSGLRKTEMPLIFPVHPRTKALAEKLGVGRDDNIVLCDPLSYFDMVGLLVHAHVVCTDSGGIQKEAFALRVPCVTLRDETEWNETLTEGWNVLTGTSPEFIAKAAMRAKPSSLPKAHGEPNCSARIVDRLLGLTAPGAFLENTLVSA